MPMGDRGAAATAAFGSAIAPRHLGRRPGLVDKDQLAGVEIRLTVEPGLPAAPDIRPLLLAGVRGFF